MKPDSYPVRRRGERRELLPNRAGIEWLEGEAFKSDTEIVYTETLGVLEDCLKITYASGRSQKLHSRPMFDVLDGSAFSGFPPSVQPCASCDDFARSWNCEEHHERQGDYEQITRLISERWFRVQSVGARFSFEGVLDDD